MKINTFNELSTDDVIDECKFVLSDFIDDDSGEISIKNHTMVFNRKDSGSTENSTLINIYFEKYSSERLINLTNHLDYLNLFLEDNGYFVTSILGNYEDYDDNFNWNNVPFLCNLLEELKKSLKNKKILNPSIWYKKDLKK
jgi:hypothetical protein